jgi:UDP-N-acetyl-2-amino-2-deoxyglucuronate dehydrogenase
VKWYRPPEYYRDSEWRGTWSLDGGGALMNQGIHTVDALVWLLGPVASVCARVATACHDIEVEDTVVATIEFRSGALATYEATTAAYPGYPRRIEITGTDGTLLVEGDRLAAVDLRTPAGLAATAADAASPAVSSPPSSSSPVMSDIVPHRRVFEDFIDAVRTGRAPACDGNEGRKSLAVVEAIYASARSGKTVHVSMPDPTASSA